MNQGQLVHAIARKFHLTRAESRRIVKFSFSEVTNDLKKGRRVCFHGFGSFTKKKYPGKRVRHPKTGKMIWFPPKTVVDFNPSKLLLKVLK